MSAIDRTDEVIRQLGNGCVSSSALGQLLTLSQSSVSRALRSLITDGRVLRIGSTRGAQYGLRRSIEGIGDAWPLHRVSRTGEIEELGTLFALAADQYYFQPTPALPNEGFAAAGISEGIPYFLQDQRPGGFLGRAVPHKFPELRLPQRVVDWKDEHYLRYLTQRGSDAIGDLMLGKVALDEYLRARTARDPSPSSRRSFLYPEFASSVMEGGLPGSSAHGEHPKFTAPLRDAAEIRHVLVKFSPFTNTAVGVRWSDLLIAEHHALVVLGDNGVLAAPSRIFQFEDRTYLEVDRFDRVLAEGRVGVTSLLAIDTHLYGKLDNWIESAARLYRDERIDAETLERVRLLSTFGALIANSDRHFGNLSFFDEYRGTFALAPVYDMLPMLFAPEHNQVVVRTFVPPEAGANTLRVYARAGELALEFWTRVVSDARVSADFGKIATDCRAAVARLLTHIPRLASREL